MSICAIEFTDVAKYNGYRVGFFGYDEACVVLDLNQPQVVTTYEEEPARPGHRLGYSVFRTSMEQEVLTQDLLQQEIDIISSSVLRRSEGLGLFLATLSGFLAALSGSEEQDAGDRGHAQETLAILCQARAALEEFIRKNGRSSPNSPDAWGGEPKVASSPSQPVCEMT